MSNLTTTANNITNDTLQFIPAVAAGIQAAELSGASGQNKKQAVLDAIQAGSQAGTQISIPQVAAISGMINLFVSIFNSLGLFKHSSTPAAPTTAVIKAN